MLGSKAPRISRFSLRGSGNGIRSSHAARALQDQDLNNNNNNNNINNNNIDVIVLVIAIVVIMCIVYTHGYSYSMVTYIGTGTVIAIVLQDLPDPARGAQRVVPVEDDERLGGRGGTLTYYMIVYYVMLDNVM